MDEIAFRTATDLAADIRARRIGCVELLQHYLARVDRINPALNAIIAMDRDGALARAADADAALDRGETWGPLHGVPMTIKESYDVVGMPTTWGVPELKDNIATSNAAAVDRLLAAGVVLFGKTNVPLLLGDWQTFNAIYGTTNNPWDVTRGPGGSSGGSAAVLATGMAALEAGSDIGASIRNPAHYCGVYGHKPTYGVVSPRGQAVPGILAPSDISVVGPLARSAEDLGLALDVMAGAEGQDAVGWRLELPGPRHTALKDFRVGVLLEDPNCAVDVQVAERIQAVADAVSNTGARVDDKARPDIDTRRSHALYLQLLRAVTTARQPQEVFEQTQRDVAALSPDDDSYAARVARASVQYHRQWVAANEERTHLRQRWAEFFSDFDVLLCPAAPTPAFPHDQERDRLERTVTINGREEDYNDQLFWAGYSGVVYLPSTVAPAGLAPSGLPVGVQIIGAHLEDRTTIEFARLLADEIGGFVAPLGYD